MKRNLLRPLLACLALTAALHARAANPETSRFRLIIDQTSQTWNYDDDTRSDTRVTRARAIWDQNLDPRLRGTLELSYLDMSQSRALSVVPLNGTGYGIGVGLYGTLVQTRSLRLGSFGKIDYQSTRGENDLASVDRNWWDGRLGLQLGVPIGRTLTLVGGGGYQAIGGEEIVATGGSESRRDFELDDPLYAYAGADLAADGGFVGLRVYAGNRTGGYLTFGVRY